MATCHVCPLGDQSVPDYDMPDHVRVLHPDLRDDPMELWPDGGFVVLDTTLGPDDFGGAR